MSRHALTYKGWRIEVIGSQLNSWKWCLHHAPQGLNGCDGQCSDIETHVYRSLDSWLNNPSNRGIPQTQTLYFHWHSDAVDELKRVMRDPGDPPTSPLGVVNPPEAKRVMHYPNGVICKKCNMKNEFGEPNQADGKYLCYVCR